MLGRSVSTWLRLGAAGLLVVVSTLPASAQDEKSWSLEVGYDYSSIYLFRGVDLLAGEPVHVPRVVFGAGGLSVAYFGYFGDQGEDGPSYEEHDFSVDYTFALGDKMELTLGALTYQYPDETSGIDTYEVYAIAAFDIPLNPSIAFNYDLDAFDGGYAVVSIGHGVPLGSRASMDFSLGYGIDFGYNDVDSSGASNDLLLGVDLPLQITDRFSLHAGYLRSVALDSLDTLGQGDEDVVTVGGAFSF